MMCTFKKLEHGKESEVGSSERRPGRQVRPGHGHAHRHPDTHMAKLKPQLLEQAQCVFVNGEWVHSQKCGWEDGWGSPVSENKNLRNAPERRSHLKLS